MWGGQRDRTSVLVTLSCQEMPSRHRRLLGNVEGVEPFLLAGVRGPSLAAMQQGAEDAGVVHGNLRLHNQLGVCAHSRC